MVETIYDLVAGMPGPLAVFLLGMAPISELRGAIPLGIVGFRMAPLETFLWAVAGNMVPVFAVLFAFDPVARFLRRHSRLFDRFFEKLFDRTRRRAGPRFERWRDLALVSFVAIPLPLTGAYTGALAAVLFGVRPSRAVPLVGVGVLIAGAIVTMLVVSGSYVLGLHRP